MNDSKSRGAAAGAIFRSAVESTRTPEAAKVATEKVPDIAVTCPQCGRTKEMGT